MSAFRLHSDGQADHTLVSNVFLDEYMPAANGEYVKVYLFLLRCLNSDAQELTIPLIADKFEHTESDVRRALKYWEKLHLLKLEYDDSKNLTGVCLTDGSRSSAPAPEETVRSRRKATKTLRPEEAKQLLFICEQYLGKTLSSSEVSKLLEFHDSLGFSADLIEYLVEYCVSIRHKSIHYIEAVALSWHEAGYKTVAEAKQQTSAFHKAYFSILKAFGISNRNPVQVEITYMDKWMKEYGFSLELITESCSRTMAAIHQPSFEYADKILTTWKQQQVKTPADLSALDDKHQSAKSKPESKAPAKSATPNSFRNFRERDYDFKKLEEQLMNI